MKNVGITPSQLAINSNLEALARCAVICQHNGLVPILQPEIICMGDFGIDAVEAVTEKVLSSLFKVLLEHHVLLEAMILNPNMVRSGFEAAVPGDTCCIALIFLFLFQLHVQTAHDFLSQSYISLITVNSYSYSYPYSYSYSYSYS